MAEQTSGEPGSLSAGLAVPNSLNAPSEPVAASAQPSMPEAIDVDSPKLAPEQGASGETPKVEGPKADAPKTDAAKTDAPKADAPKIDAPRTPGKVLIMSAGDRAGPAPEAGPAARGIADGRPPAVRTMGHRWPGPRAAQCCRS